MVEIVTCEGPLDADRLGWIADLYGRVDPKYAETAFLEHLFSHAPAGPALHAFALADERPVGHCAVVPMFAGNDVRTLLCGKVEALFVEEGHRGRRRDAPPVAVQMRDRLYELASEKGIELLHAYVLLAIEHDQRARSHGPVVDLPVRRPGVAYGRVTGPDLSYREGVGDHDDRSPRRRPHGEELPVAITAAIEEPNHPAPEECPLHQLRKARTRRQRRTSLLFL